MMAFFDRKVEAFRRDLAPVKWELELERFRHQVADLGEKLMGIIETQGDQIVELHQEIKQLKEQVSGERRTGSEI
jgi:hypothetical protein